MSVLKIQPYSYQMEGIEFAKTMPYSINACEVGLGKSLQAIYVSDLFKHKTAIICPAYLKKNWERELNKLSYRAGEYKIVSYAKALEVDDYFDMYIIDEAHYLKNIKAKRTQNIHNMIRKFKPTRVMMLTGTPIKNRVPEYFSLLQICYYGGMMPIFNKYAFNYWGFCRKFCNEIRLELRRRKITKFEGINQKNIEELKSLVKKCTFRRKAKDVLDLPLKNYIEIYSGKTSYDEDYYKAYKAYVEGRKKDIDHFSVKKVTHSQAKAPFTAQVALDIIEQGEQVIIFTDHVISAQQIFKTINSKHESGIITGDTPIISRDMTISDFINFKISALIMTIGSGSTGLNLMNCRNMIFNDYPWVPSDIDQAEGRISRIGQKNQCNYYYILTGEMDKYILESVRKKREVIKQL